MTHEEFLDLLLDKLRQTPELYVHSAPEEREDEAVARWMVAELGGFLAQQSLAYEFTAGWFARTDRVFAYWERHNQERVIFRVTAVETPRDLDCRVTRTVSGYLLELYDFLRNIPLPGYGAVTGQREPAESGRIKIVTVIPSRRRRRHR